jgi:hypothetical protein
MKFIISLADYRVRVIEVRVTRFLRVACLFIVLFTIQASLTYAYIAGSLPAVSVSPPVPVLPEPGSTFGGLQ